MKNNNKRDIISELGKDCKAVGLVLLGSATLGRAIAGKKGDRIGFMIGCVFILTGMTMENI